MPVAVDMESAEAFTWLVSVIKFDAVRKGLVPTF